MTSTLTAPAPVPTLLSGPLYRIEQDVESLSPVTLSEVQARVCAVLETHPHFCDFDDDIEAETTKRVTAVKATKTIAEIHALVSFDNFMAY